MTLFPYATDQIQPVVTADVETYTLVLFPPCSLALIYHLLCAACSCKPGMPVQNNQELLMRGRILVLAEVFDNVRSKHVLHTAASGIQEIKGEGNTLDVHLHVGRIRFAFD